MASMSYSSYGVLKGVGEYYTRALNGLIVKFWNVYGVERDEAKAHVITDFVRMAKQDKVIKMLTNGLESRQMLYADDACEALFILSTHYHDLPRDKELHITSFEWVRVLAIAELIARLTGATVEPAASTDEVQKDARNEPDDFILDYWQPKTSLKEGITKIIHEL
jgi:nucleoside-diphosphate-sugar epimerase